MIPKKIHYCWFGGKAIPKIVQKCIKSWKKMCPDYEIILWNESNFDIECNKFVYEAYKAKEWAFVSDYARLKIIYENGGIYLDTDVELLKNMDDILENKCYFPIQQCDKNIATGLGFGSTKNNKIIKEMMDVYENLEFDINKKDEFICPILNTEVLKKYGYEYREEKYFLDETNITIYPPKYFDPIAPGNSENLLCDDTISIHNYTALWTNNSTRLKRKIINIVGQDKVNKLKGFFKNE